MGVSDGNQAIIALTVAVVGSLFVLAALASGMRNRDDVKREPLLALVRSNFTKLSPHYGEIPLYEGNSSYTENKSSITLCLRDQKTASPYDSNTLMYVALHELAHVISKTYGHGDEFKKNFAALLDRAEKLGFYDSKIPLPSNYCGVQSID